MPKIVQPVQPPFLKVDFIQRLVPLLLQNPHPLRLSRVPLEQPHIVGDLIMLKANIMQGRNHAQTLNILIVILSDTHDGFDCIAQSPALVLSQNRN